MGDVQNKLECKSCNKIGKIVSKDTLKYFLSPNVFLEKDTNLYFCKTPDCDAIYFNDDIKIIQDDVKVFVGLKNVSPSANVCYCFKWSREKIKLQIQTSGETLALGTIQSNIKKFGCSCEILNPSGECCLSDISNIIKEYKKA